jgi:hypothetical protein
VECKTGPRLGGRPPVDHHPGPGSGRGRVAPDVVKVAVHPVDPAEAQRRLLRQVRQPGQEHLVDGLLSVGVREKYLAAHPDFTKLNLLDAQISMMKAAKDLLEAKAFRLKLAMGFLALGVILVAVGIPIR